MMKVSYKSIKRPQKPSDNVSVDDSFGRTDVVLTKDDLVVTLGHINVEYGGLFFHAHDVVGLHIGTWSSRSQAGEALKKLYIRRQKDGDATLVYYNKQVSPSSTTIDTNDTIITRTDAAAKLNISMDALRKRIARGTVQQVTKYGEKALYAAGERTDYVVL